MRRAGTSKPAFRIAARTRSLAEHRASGEAEYGSTVREDAYTRNSPLSARIAAHPPQTLGQVAERLLRRCPATYYRSRPVVSSATATHSSSLVAHSEASSRRMTPARCHPSGSDAEARVHRGVSLPSCTCLARRFRTH